MIAGGGGGFHGWRAGRDAEASDMTGSEYKTAEFPHPTAKRRHLLPGGEGSDVENEISVGSIKSC